MSARRPTERSELPRVKVATTPCPPILATKGHAEFGQLLLHEGARRLLVAAQLRMSMEMPAPAGQRVVQVAVQDRCPSAGRSNGSLYPWPAPASAADGWRCPAPRIDVSLHDLPKAPVPLFRKPWRGQTRSCPLSTPLLWTPPGVRPPGRSRKLASWWRGSRNRARRRFYSRPAMVPPDCPISAPSARSRAPRWCGTHSRS